MCDQMMIDIDENRVDEKGIDQAGVHRYRIRQPGGLPRPETEDPSPRLGPGQVVAAGQQVTAVVGSLPGGEPGYTARLLCVWDPGYMPTETDAALIGVPRGRLVLLLFPRLRRGPSPACVRVST